MATKKKQLGKGLEAIFEKLGQQEDRQSEVKQQGDGAGIVFVALSAIRTNPEQPRRHFSEEELAELAASIKTYGVIQPITVKKIDGARGYQLIAGERRVRAARLAGLEKIPAFVIDKEEQIDDLELALIENIQREDLNPIEIALAYRQLIDEHGYTQEQLSARIGKKRSTITNYLRLLQLPPEIQWSVAQGELSMGHARVLAGIKDPLHRSRLYERCLQDHLSVRELEKLASTEKKKGPKKNTHNEDSGQASVHWQAVQQMLSERLGTRVQFQLNAKGGGKILIPFRNVEHLNEILDQLQGE